jgi:hypothetical protein
MPQTTEQRVWNLVVFAAANVPAPATAAAAVG